MKAEGATTHGRTCFPRMALSPRSRGRRPTNTPSAAVVHSRAFVLALVVASAAGYSSGWTGCLDTLTSPHTSAISGTGSHTITLKDASGTVVSSYVGGTTYTVTLGAGSSFRGLLMSGFQATQATLGTAFAETPQAGVMSPVDTRTQAACNVGLTQTSSSTKASVAGSWAAPPPGSGTVTFMAFVVLTTSTTYRVYLEVPEAAGASPSAAATPSPASTPAPTSSLTAAATPSTTGTPSRSPTPTATRSSTPTPSPTRTHTGTPTQTASPTGTPPGTASTTGSATAASSPGASPSPTSSVPGSPPPSGSATPPATASGTAASSSSASPSDTASASTTQTASVSSSATATASPSLSGSATPPPTQTASPTASLSPASATAAPTRSPTHTATGSPTHTPSAPPSAAGAGAGYAHAAALDGVLTLRWTVRAAAAAIDFRLEAAGQRWVSVAPAAPPPGVVANMVNAGYSVVGSPVDGNAASTSAVRSYAIDGIALAPAAAGAGGITAAGTAYDAASDSTALWWTHPVSPPAGDVGIEVDFAGALAAPLPWIWAYGPVGSGWSMHVACGVTHVVLDASGCSRAASCGGHGDCLPSGACACDAGYGGTSCDVCVPPYAATDGGASGGGCALLDAPLRAAGLAMYVTLPLAGTPFGAGGGGGGGGSVTGTGARSPTPSAAAPSPPSSPSAAALPATPAGTSSAAPPGSPSASASASPVPPQSSVAPAPSSAGASSTASRTATASHPRAGATSNGATPPRTRSAARSGGGDGGGGNGGNGTGSEQDAARPLEPAPVGTASLAAARTAFAAALAADVAAAAGVPAATVTATLGAGDANVTFAFSPPATTSNASAVVAEGLDDLRTALANASSPLFAAPAGRYLAHAPVDNGTTAAVAAVATFAVAARADPAAVLPFAAPLMLRDGAPLTLKWRVDGDGWVLGELAFGGDAWFGLGFAPGSSTAMSPADGLACEPAAAAAAQVTQYTLGGYTTATCPAAPGSPLLFAPASVLYRNPDGPGWVCRFRRRVDGGAAVALPAAAGGGALTPRTVVGAGAVVVTSAHGAHGVRSMGLHSTRESGAVLIDFATGAWRAPPPPPGVALLAHAVAGALALGLLLPAGAVVARYYRGVGASPAPGSSGGEAAVRPGHTVWLRVHVLLSALGAVGAVLAAVLGAAATRTALAPAAARLPSLHGALGAAAAALAAALVGAALPCARPPVPTQPTRLAAPKGRAVGGLGDDGATAPLPPPAVGDDVDVSGGGDRRWVAWARMHAAAGWALLALGVPTVLTGIFAAGGGDVGGGWAASRSAVGAAVAAYAAWVAVAAAVTVAHEACAAARARRGGGSGVPPPIDTKVTPRPATVPLAAAPRHGGGGGGLADSAAASGRGSWATGSWGSRGSVRSWGGGGSAAVAGAAADAASGADGPAAPSSVVMLDDNPLARRAAAERLRRSGRNGGGGSGRGAEAPVIATPLAPPRRRGWGAAAAPVGDSHRVQTRAGAAAASVASAAPIAGGSGAATVRGGAGTATVAVGGDGSHYAPPSPPSPPMPPPASGDVAVAVAADGFSQCAVAAAVLAAGSSSSRHAEAPRSSVVRVAPAAAATQAAVPDDVALALLPPHRRSAAAMTAVTGRARASSGAAASPPLPPRRAPSAAGQPQALQ